MLVKIDNTWTLEICAKDFISLKRCYFLNETAKKSPHYCKAFLSNECQCSEMLLSERNSLSDHAANV